MLTHWFFNAAQSESILLFFLSLHSSPIYAVWWLCCRVQTWQPAQYGSIFWDHSLNNSFSNCLRNLNKKSSIHTKKLLLMHEAQHAHTHKDAQTPVQPGQRDHIWTEARERCCQSLRRWNWRICFHPILARSQQELENVCGCLGGGWVCHYTVFPSRFHSSLTRWFIPPVTDSTSRRVPAQPPVPPSALWSSAFTKQQTSCCKILNQLVLSHTSWHLFHTDSSWACLPWRKRLCFWYGSEL